MTSVELKVFNVTEMALFKPAYLTCSGEGRVQISGLQ